MSTVKRTFSIPAELDVVIPNRARAKFIASSLRDALRERKRKELLDLLDCIPSKENLDGTQSEFEFGPLGEICALNERLQHNSLPGLDTNRRWQRGSVENANGVIRLTPIEAFAKSIGGAVEI